MPWESCWTSAFGWVTPPAALTVEAIVSGGVGTTAGAPALSALALRFETMPELAAAARLTDAVSGWPVTAEYALAVPGPMRPSTAILATPWTTARRLIWVWRFFQRARTVALLGRQMSPFTV